MRAHYPAAPPALSLGLTPSPASPGLSFDFSELTHADCHKGACVEVPCYLEAGVIGLWSAEGWGAGERIPELRPRLPQGALVFEAVMEHPMQVPGPGAVSSHPNSRALSIACRVRMRAGPLPTHRSWPSSVGDGNASSSRPMLMRTWLVSGQTWGVDGERY